MLNESTLGGRLVSEIAPGAGQVLTWDAVNGCWRPSAISAGSIIARGIIHIAFGACTWLFPPVGFNPANPVYAGVGRYTVDLAVADPVAVLFCTSFGAGQAFETGPPVGTTYTINVTTPVGANSAPAGWGAGAVLGTEIFIDPAYVGIFAMHMG